MKTQERIKLTNYLRFLSSIGFEKLYLDKNSQDSIAKAMSSADRVAEVPHPPPEGTQKPKQQLPPPPAKVDSVQASRTFLEEVAQSRKIKQMEDNKQAEDLESKNNLVNDSVPKDWAENNSLQTLNQAISSCLACQLGYTRNQFVFGDGNPNAKLMFVGEAPGADEDKHGKPFVGRAGQLLTKIINAMGFERDEVYIANVIKCRPPANRRPTKDEVAECKPYLLKQIEIIKPDFIIGLGLTAAESLTGQKLRMKDIRGVFQDFHGTPLMVTYHPAALLRNPNWKKNVWEDMLKLLEKYNELNPDDLKTPPSKQ